MRLGILLVSAGLCLAPLGFSASQVLDPCGLPEEWRALFEHLRNRTPLRAVFSEERVLPYRRNPVVLDGILRLDTDKGLSLHYPEAEGAPTTVIDAVGMATRSDENDWRALPDRRSIRSTHAAMAALLALDFSQFGDEFDMIGELDRARWSVQLSPKSGSNTGRLKRLRIAGTPDRVNQLCIDLGGKSFINIKLTSEESVPAFQPEEYARFFR